MLFLFYLFTILADPTAGSAVLGSQGDQWDAQKDMLTNGLGALIAGINRKHLDLGVKP